MVPHFGLMYFWRGTSWLYLAAMAGSLEAKEIFVLIAVHFAL